MSGKLKPYPQYKESDVEWLGEVPEHWVLDRIKSHFQIEKRISGSLDYDVLSITQKGIVVKDIDSGEGQLSMDYSKYQLIFKGEFGMNHMDLLTGYIDISKYNGVVSPDYRVFSIKNQIFNTNFYLYVFQTCYINKIFYKYGQGSSQLGRWRLPSEEFYGFRIPTPSPDEQTNIANYLDQQTAKIDKLVENYQKLITLSKEKRTALITHCVTKGLDPTVKMKDSGVKWLGKVPEGWSNVSLKHCFLINPRKSEIASHTNFDCSFIPMEKLKTDAIKLDLVKPIKEVYEGYNYFRDGDILMAKVTPCFENSNIAIANDLYNGIGFGSSEIYTLRPLTGVSTRYLFYRLQESTFMIMSTSEMTGAGGLKRVPQEYIANYIVSLPSPNEQTAIAKYLDQQTAKIDQTIEKAQQAIDLLKEKRTALITAVVTGKVDVRECV